MATATENTGIITDEVKTAITGEAPVAEPKPDSMEALEAEMLKNPPKSLEEMAERLKNKRNLDTGFETANFNIGDAINEIMQLDKFTKISVLNSVKFFINTQCINQALRMMPEGGIDLTVDGREDYDRALQKVMEDYETEGDFAPTLPAFLALNDHLRAVMYDDMLEPSAMEDTLEFLTREKPVAGNFEKDYDERVRLGQRPGISKREFCELQLEDALKRHEKMANEGQAAIQFCNDLPITGDRGWGDLPDWAVDTIYNKIVDKLANRWAKLDIRRTNIRTRPTDRDEAQADQMMIEFVYEAFTGRKFATEY